AGAGAGGGAPGTPRGRARPPPAPRPPPVPLRPSPPAGEAAMTVLDAVLTQAVSSGASDVYFLEGVVPAIKVDGLVSPIQGADALDADAMRGVLERLLPVRERAAFVQAGEANLSHVHP